MKFATLTIRAGNTTVYEWRGWTDAPSDELARGLAHAADVLRAGRGCADVWQALAQSIAWRDGRALVVEFHVMGGEL